MHAVVKNSIRKKINHTITALFVEGYHVMILMTVKEMNTIIPILAFVEKKTIRSRT